MQKKLGPKPKRHLSLAKPTRNSNGTTQRTTSASRALETEKRRARSSKKDLATEEQAPSSAEELLKFVENLKRQWMSTIDALVDPLMIVGLDYKIRKANLAMARTGGVDVKDVVGKKCYEVFAGRKKPCPGCQLQSAAQGMESMTFDLEHIRDDRFYEVSAQPLFDAEGNFDGLVHVYRDRTEAKKMQETLAQQDKLASIGLLAGGVAHEINNPLGGILIFSQMLLRELPKESTHYADVVEIEAATQRCKAIVESLLDFARKNPATPKKGEKAATIDVLEAIRTAMRFGKVSIPQSGTIDMIEDFEGEGHELLGDRNRIIQLFLNLIQNAVQAMPDGGRLSVRASVKTDPNGDEVGIYEVEDTGVGIPPEHLKKIFDPFFTTKDPGEGTGLGLALCYGIVQDMDGAMRVESSVNVGTKFIIELPINRGRVAARPAS